MNTKMTRTYKPYKSLENTFAEHGLKLKVVSDPITGRGNKNQAQIDITGNHFRLYAGKNPETKIAVQHADGKHILLMVNEPETTFKTEVTHPIKRDKIIKVVPKQSKWSTEKYLIERILPAGVRHFLMGQDERGLFISTVANVTTVQSALNSLKRKPIVEAEKKVKVVRQGEWFFVPATKEEVHSIELSGITHRNHSIGDATKVRSGKPHVAQELVVAEIYPLGHFLPEVELGYNLTRYNNDPVVNNMNTPYYFAVFVRGKVAHEDHKSVQFSCWMKVIKNNERPNVTGGKWFD